LNDFRGFFHPLSITPVGKKFQSLCQAAKESRLRGGSVNEYTPTANS
jgi:hypothetical protein